MGLSLLHRNRITGISTDSSSTDDEGKMLSDNSWEKWVGDNESSTTITGIFGGVSSPGELNTIDSIAIVHTLPLNTTVDIVVHDKDAAPDVVMYTSPTIVIKKPSELDGYFSSTEYDSNGNYIDEGRNWHVFIHYLTVPVIATELDITLTYPGAIDPQIRYIYAGEKITTGFNIARDYAPVVEDYSRRSVSYGGNVNARKAPMKNGIDMKWPAITQSERMRFEQARLYLGTAKPCIVDVFGGDDYKSSYDRIWGIFDEPIEIKRRPDTVDDYYTAAVRIMEH